MGIRSFATAQDDTERFGMTSFASVILSRAKNLRYCLLHTSNGRLLMNAIGWSALCIPLLQPHRQETGLTF